MHNEQTAIQPENNRFLFLRFAKNKAWKALVFILSSALVSAVVSSWYNHKLAEKTNYLSVLQTRISTCFELASHHKNMMEKYPNETNPSNLILIIEEDRKMVDTDQKVADSTNEQRHKASIYMGRGLGVCLAKHDDFDSVVKCVNEVTTRPKSESSNRVIDDQGRGRGKENPAC